MKNGRLVLMKALFSLAVGGEAQTVRFVFPEAPPVLVRSERLTPDTVTLSWSAVIGRGYIVEKCLHTPNVWVTDSILVASETPITKSIPILREPCCFYRVRETSGYGTGQMIEWLVSLRRTPLATVYESTADWFFDDGSTVSVTGESGWNSPITNSYSSPGVKEVRVQVHHPDGWLATNRWAVTITNSSKPEAVLGPNLVRNGDFEEMTDSNPIAWQRGGYGDNNRQFTYPVPGFDGSAKAARVIVCDYESGDAKWYHNDVGVTPGHVYRFSDWYICDERSDVTARFEMEDGSVSYEGLAEPDRADDWEQVEIDVTAPLGARLLSVFHNAVTNSTLTIDTVSIREVVGTNVPPSGRGKLVFRFDDGWRESAFTASNKLVAAGFRGTFFVVITNIGGDDFLTREQIVALERSGHEIGGHTVTHPDLTLLSSDAVRDELRLSGESLRSYGVQTLTSFAYPYGAVNETVKGLVREAGYLCAFTSESGLDQVGLIDAYAMKSMVVLATTTLDEVKAMVDSVAADPTKLLVLTFHHVDTTITDYSVTPEFLQAVIDYVVVKRAEVVTATEGFRLMTTPR